MVSSLLFNDSHIAWAVFIVGSYIPELSKTGTIIYREFVRLAFRSFCLSAPQTLILL